MRIEKLIIKNFRSFDSKGVELVFPDSINYYVLVGPNASGKSNLIEAIRWVTLQRSVGGDTIEPSDFHSGNTKESLEIEAHISPHIKRATIYNQIHEAAIFKLLAKEYERTEEAGSIRCDHPALKKDGSYITLPSALPRKKGQSATQEEKEAMPQTRPLIVRDIKDKYEIYYIDHANYGYHLTMRAGSLLYRLARILSDDLMRDANKIETEDGVKNRLEIVNDLLGNLAQVLKTDRVDKFTKSMETFLKEQIQLPDEALNIEIGLPRGDALLKKLDLNAKDHKDPQMLPIEQLGRGFSALAMVGLFQAINGIDDEKQGAIFLLEEPECYLGPHLRTVFSNTLRELAKRGNQIFVATHSPEFFDAMFFESAIVVEKKNGISTQCHQIRSKIAYSLDKSVKFVEPNLSSLLFSKYVLLVEGPDDFSVFHKAFDIIDFHPAYKGLSILNTGGKGNIPFLYSVCKNLQMPVFVIADEDYETNLKKLDNRGNSYFILRPDLERALITSKAKSNNTQHVVETINTCSNGNDLKNNFPQIHEALIKVKGFFKL